MVIWTPTVLGKTEYTKLSVTEPPIQWIQGALSVGIKLPEREVNHSPPTSAEVKE
jgi:hypothetical protein